MKFHKSKSTSGEKAFSQSEWNKFIRSVDHLEDEVLFKLTVTAGFRREDICHGSKKKWVDKKSMQVITGIPIDDIDYDERTITYKEHKKNRIRKIYISPDIILLIKKLINARGKHQSKWLITYSGATAYRKLQMYCDRAGVARRPFHALRATCVKFCIDAGWSDEKISALTGDTIAVIQTHYMTPSSDEMMDISKERPII